MKYILLFTSPQAEEEEEDDDDDDDDDDDRDITGNDVRFTFVLLKQPTNPS